MDKDLAPPSMPGRVCPTKTLPWPAIDSRLNKPLSADKFVVESDTSNWHAPAKWRSASNGGTSGHIYETRERIASDPGEQDEFITK